MLVEYLFILSAYDMKQSYIYTMEWVEVYTRAPFRCTICGPSCCGKTYFTLNFLKDLDRQVYPKITKIVYFYSEWQKEYESFVDHVTFCQGIPDNFDNFSKNEQALIILDDQMGNENKLIMALFFKLSHHRNISVLYICLLYTSPSPRDS